MRRASFQYLPAVILTALALALSGCGTRLADPVKAIAEADKALASGKLEEAAIHVRNATQAGVSDPAVRLRLAQLSLRLAQFIPAEEDARKALAGNADAGAARFVLFEALLGQGQAAKALQEYAALKPVSPSVDAMSAAYAAQAAIKLGRFDEASALANKALALDAASASGRAAGLAAMAQDAAGRSRVREAAQVLARDHPGSFEAQSLLAFLDQRDGRLKEAAVGFEKASTLHPWNSEVHGALITVLLDAGALEGAAQRLAQLKKLAPSLALTVFLEGLVHYRRGHLIEADQALASVIAGGLETPETLRLSGEVSLRLGNLGRAESLARQLLAKAPNLLTGHKLLGATHLAGNAPEKALAVLAPVAHHPAVTPEILALIGEALVRTGDTAKGVAFIDAALARNPASLPMKLAAAQARVRAGDAAAGLSLVEELAQTSSGIEDLTLVRSLLSLKQYDKALTLAQRFASRFPQDPAGPMTIGVIAASQHQVEAAQAGFAQALSLSPGYPPAVEALAQLEAATGKIDQARQRYMGLARAEPNNPAYPLALARLSARSGAAEKEVLDHFAQARAASGSAPWVALEQARFWTSRGRDQEVVSLLEPLVQANPKDTDLALALTNAYDRSGQAAKALALVERGLQDNASSAALHFRAGLLRSRMGDGSGAVASLTRANQLQPSANEPAIALATTLYATGNKVAAEAFVRQFGQGEQSGAVAQVLQGDFRSMDGNAPAALVHYRTAFQAVNNPLTRRKLYESLLLNQRDDEARQQLRQWAARYPDDVGTLQFAAEKLLERERWKETAEVLNEVIKRNPESVQALNNAAIAVHRLGVPQALELARRAYQLESWNATVMDTYGWILSEQGKAEEGLPLLRKASEILPGNLRIRLHLAQALVRAGDRTAARDQVARIASANPSPAIRKELELIR